MGRFMATNEVTSGESAKIAVLCCKLHNYILEQFVSIMVPLPSGKDSFNQKESPVRTVQLQDGCDTNILFHYRRRDKEASEWEM